AEDGIRVFHVTGVQTCALPIWCSAARVVPPRARLFAGGARGIVRLVVGKTVGARAAAIGRAAGGRQVDAPPRVLGAQHARARAEIGRASCRERVCEQVVGGG